MIILIIHVCSSNWCKLQILIQPVQRENYIGTYTKVFLQNFFLSNYYLIRKWKSFSIVVAFTLLLLPSFNQVSDETTQYLHIALCVIFTILVSFSWDNALFASKAKINVSNGAARRGQRSEVIVQPPKAHFLTFSSENKIMKITHSVVQGVGICSSIAL